MKKKMLWIFSREKYSHTSTTHREYWKFQIILWSPLNEIVEYTNKLELLDQSKAEGSNAVCSLYMECTLRREILSTRKWEFLLIDHEICFSSRKILLI